MSNKMLKDFQAVTYTRKGIIESITKENITKKIALEFFKQPEIDIADTEKIIQYSALNQLFFSNFTKKTRTSQPHP